MGVDSSKAGAAREGKWDGRRSARSAKPIWLRLRILRRLLAGLIVLGLGVAFTGPTARQALAAPTSPDYQQIIQSEAQFVASAQIHTCQGTSAYGAITLTSMNQSDESSLYISPYDANYAVRALIAAGGPYLPLAKDWLTWYMTHANWPDDNGLMGSIYNYIVNLNTCTLSVVTQDNRPFYDSTDAYAATFLSAMKAYAAADPGDAAWLQSPIVSTLIDKEARVAVSTMMPNGLTWATPAYHGQYLMDNTEVYQGLNDYVWLLQNVLHNTEFAGAWQSWATVLANGIETYIFDDVMQTPGTTPMYGWASYVTQVSWSTCYPDATAQLWTVFTQAGPLSRRQATWAGYKAADPGWSATTPGWPDISCPQHDPEAPAAYAAAMVGDKSGVDAWLVNSDANWVTLGHPYPWTASDSGYRAMAAQQASTL